MSRTTAQTRSCGKRAYGSLKAARKALRGHTGSFAVLHAYRCERCFKFHLGHKTKAHEPW